MTTLAWFRQDLRLRDNPAAFAGYLAARETARSGTLRWVVEQGFEMGRPSILHVEADLVDGKVSAVRVGGTAVRMSEGTLAVDAT